MAVYQLDDWVPEIAASAWVADSASVIGRVRMDDPEWRIGNDTAVLVSRYRMHGVEDAAGRLSADLVWREGQWLEVEVMPARVEGNVGQIGVQVGYMPPPPTAFRHLDLGFFQAIPRAAGETVDQTVLLLQAIKKLVMGHLSPKNLSGPLGIAKVAGVSASLGFEAFCQMLAVLSISLGVMNLLPIPMLDGGHLMLFLAEACRGKPLSEKVQLWGSQIGMLLLAGLMLFAIYNDILKFR